MGNHPPQQDDEANILARASAYINHREVGYSRDLTDHRRKTKIRHLRIADATSLLPADEVSSQKCQ